MALLTSLAEEAVPQAIEVVGQPEQGGLALLHRQATSRGTGGEFAFDDGEDRFHLGSLPVGLLRKPPPHLSANAHATVATTFGLDDAMRSQLFANVPMVLFGVKFGIGQHQANRRDPPWPHPASRADSGNRSRELAARAAPE